MQVVILAAGQGTRLRPITHDRPKSMLNVAGRPLLHHMLESLVAHGVTEVELVVGHGHDKIRAYFGDGKKFGIKIRYTQQARQLGPGHALRQVQENITSDTFIVLPADAWYHHDLLGRILAADGPAMVLVPDVRSGRHGIPVIRRGQVVDLELHRPPDASGASGGTYCLPRRIFEHLHETDLRLRDAVRRDLAGNSGWRLIRAEPTEYLDLIEVQDLLRLHESLMRSITPSMDGTLEQNVQVSGLVHVGEGSTIRAGSVLMGPVYVGNNCLIGPNAVLAPGTSVRNHVVVEPFTIIRRSTIFSNITVGSHSRVIAAAVDDGARIGSGAHLAGREGILVGSDASLGDDVVVSDGGRIGRRAVVADGRRVTDVPDGGMAV